MKEPIFRNCCCCCDLKIGSCIYVGLCLLVSTLEFLQTIGSLGSSRYYQYYDNAYGYERSYSRNYGAINSLEWVKFLNILICIANIIACIIFFKGVSSKKPNLLRPFIIIQTISLVLITVVLLFTLPFIGEALFLVLFISAIPIGISAYLIACVYSFYVFMENGSDFYAGHVYAPQVVVQQQMPQNYQLQTAYYIPNQTVPLYPPASPSYPPNAYSPGPYNPVFYQPPIYDPHSVPTN